MFLSLAAGLLALSACNEFHMKAPTGELSVVIVDDDVIATKASDTSERSYERKINDLQIFVFDDGTLFRYERIDRNLTSFPYTKSFGQIKSGTYTVWAVANADNLSDVTSEEELAETFIFLTDCGLTDATGDQRSSRSIFGCRCRNGTGRFSDQRALCLESGRQRFRFRLGEPWRTG